MSATVKTKPVKRAPLAVVTTKRVGTKLSDVLIISGPPRVHLLPPEVHAKKRARELRRRLGLGLIGSIVLVGLGVGLATVSMFGAQAALLNQQNQAASIASQAVRYADVTKAQADSLSIKSAQTLAMAGEISWAPYLADLQKTLSPGMSITDIKASLDASTGAAAPVVPLQGPRIATLDVKVSTPQASISSWLNQLPTLNGFVDATPGSVTLNSGLYTVDVVIHVDKEALANRFAIKTNK